jgi:hypothetical protein
VCGSGYTVSGATSCSAGVLTAATCTDIDECATNNGNCGDAAVYTCSNNVGAVPTCSCVNDFDGDALCDVDDSDDDNDTVPDVDDTCDQGQTGWTADSTTDPDADGCHNDEDPDDDNDSVADGSDDCPRGDTGWTSTNLTDHDSDGCQDATEDDDDDGDGVSDATDCDSLNDAVTNTNTNDVDCDGVSTAEDCDDEDNTQGALTNDADCDGVVTGEDCDDTEASVASVCSYSCVGQPNGSQLIYLGGTTAIPVECEDDWIVLELEAQEQADNGWMVSYDNRGNDWSKCGCAKDFAGESLSGLTGAWETGSAAVHSEGLGYNNKQCQAYTTFEYASDGVLLTADALKRIAQLAGHGSYDRNFDFVALSCDDDNKASPDGLWMAIEDTVGSDTYTPYDCKTGNNTCCTERAMDTAPMWDTFPMPVNVCASINTGGGVASAFVEKGGDKAVTRLKVKPVAPSPAHWVSAGSLAMVDDGAMWDECVMNDDTRTVQAQNSTDAIAVTCCGGATTAENRRGLNGSGLLNTDDRGDGDDAAFCARAKTWNEANQICWARGLTLCSADEVSASAGGGCNFDNHLNWTADACPVELAGLGGMCREDWHVSGGQCVACPEGDTREAGDDPTQGDTTCAPYVCPDSDSDGDGVKDCADICPGHDDNVDTDSDGEPDGCDALTCGLLDASSCDATACRNAASGKGGSGSCDGDVCVLTFSGHQAGYQKNVTCPSGMDCRFVCSGYQSCFGGTLQCPSSDHACSFTCSNTQTCYQSTLNGNGGTLDLSCTGYQSCMQSTVNCPDNDCDVTCASGQTAGYQMSVLAGACGKSAPSCN